MLTDAQRAALRAVLASRCFLIGAHELARLMLRLDARRRGEPVCAFCGNLPMRCYGGGRNGQWAPFVCDSCGANVETDDAGATFVARKAER